MAGAVVPSSELLGKGQLCHAEIIDAAVEVGTDRGKRRAALPYHVKEVVSNAARINVLFMNLWSALPL
jgi:hypothetical protein